MSFTSWLELFRTARVSRALERTSRRSQGLLAVAVLAVSLSSCGGSGVPGNAVAVINGAPITRAAYERYASLLARSGAAGGGKGAQAQISQQAMAALIQSAWVRGEARRLGVTVTDAALAAGLVQTKKQSFPTEKAYQSFLKRSGMTAAEVLDRVRVQLLAKEIEQEIQRGSAPVSEAQIAAYYKAHRAQLAVRGKQRSLAEVKAQIRLLIAQQSSQQRTAAFITEFQKRWKARTTCAKGYVMPLCSNAPKAKSSS